MMINAKNFKLELFSNDNRSNDQSERVFSAKRGKTCI